jgi:hypothetical protein
LGGSGFVCKTSGGVRIHTDPYLSDAVNAVRGGVSPGWPANVAAVAVFKMLITNHVTWTAP